jgi:hypothetical protein
MADRPPVKTRPITRDKLAQFLPSHELIKAFEDMASDVSKVLPDAIEGTTVDSSSLLATVAFARPPATPPAFHNAASDILAGQVFGA